MDRSRFADLSGLTDRLGARAGLSLLALVLGGIEIKVEVFVFGLRDLERVSDIELYLILIVLLDFLELLLTHKRSLIDYHEYIYDKSPGGGSSTLIRVHPANRAINLAGQVDK